MEREVVKFDCDWALRRAILTSSPPDWEKMLDVTEKLNSLTNSKIKFAEVLVSSSNPDLKLSLLPEHGRPFEGGIEIEFVAIKNEIKSQGWPDSAIGRVLYVNGAILTSLRQQRGNRSQKWRDAELIERANDSSASNKKIRRTPCHTTNST